MTDSGNLAFRETQYSKYAPQKIDLTDRRARRSASLEGVTDSGNLAFRKTRCSKYAPQKIDLTDRHTEKVPR